jgi:hypothetical protein
VKCCLLVTLLLIHNVLSLAQQRSAVKAPYTEQQVIAYAKALDVHQLDPSLSSQPLDEWLRSGPSHVEHLEWELDETCQIHPFGNGDYPLCAMARLWRGARYGQLLVLLGTMKKGIIGPPRLYEAVSVWESGFVDTGFAEKLSDLPGILRQPDVSTSVNNLYKKITALHPIGIPTGADKTVIWPYLSARLVRQLETAQACQSDYLRQHPHAEGSTQPAWMTSDLFAGENDRTASFFVNTVHKQPMPDGTFAVTVDVTEVDTPKKPNTIIAGGIPAYAVKSSWPAIATVSPENGHYLIDDIRVFEQDSTDGPSHLLSQIFGGCGGPYWTGEHTELKPPAIEVPPPPPVDWIAVNKLRSAAYKEEVAFAPAADVHQLDPLLPTQHLEDWLKSMAVHANHIEWHAGNCNIEEGPNGATLRPDGGLCAYVSFERGNARASFQVKLDEHSTTPRVKDIRVMDKDENVLTTMDEPEKKNPVTEKLSDLPRLLKEQSVIDVTRDLYDSLVTYHPLGIPKSEEMATLRTLLSAHLLEQIEAARLCQVHYAHQNSPGKPPPIWLHTGLFSGEGKSALPTASLVISKERQYDGSFLVLVWLSHKDPSAAPEKLWTTWPAQAIVRLEKGRFVVDDVRVFERPSLAGPFHLLTDSFVGCGTGLTTATSGNF